MTAYEKLSDRVNLVLKNIKEKKYSLSELNEARSKFIKNLKLTLS